MCSDVVGDVGRTGEQERIYAMFMGYINCLELQDAKRVGEYIDDDFIQHNPKLQPSGKESLLMHLEKLWERRRRNPPDTRTVSVMVDGDCVIWLRSITLPKPEDPKSTYEAFMIDIFRVANGKLAEHWDTTRL